MRDLTTSDDARVVCAPNAAGYLRERAIARIRPAVRWSPDESIWRVLRQNGYRRYVTGNACSNLGTWLQNTAQVLLAYRLTRSAGGVAAVTFAQFAGILVLGPFVGVVVDRFDRRRLLLVCQLLSASMAGALAAFEFDGLLTQNLLVTGAAGMGLIYAFTFPGQSAIVPSLVGPADVRAAMAMYVVSDNVGRALAPAAGVVIVSTIGFGWAFAFNALSFLVFFAALMRVRCHPVVQESEDRSPGPRFLDGFRMAAGSKVWQLLIIAALITVATDPIMVLGPSLSHSVLHVPAVRAGYLIAAFGCGTVLGALVKVDRLRLRLRSQLAWSIMTLYLATGIFLESRSFALSLVSAFVAGSAFLIALAALQTLLLGHSQGLAGSMMAIWAFAHCGSRPLTSLLDGWLADTYGAQSAGLVIMFAAAVFLAAVAAPELQPARLQQWFPKWLDLGRPPTAAMGTPGATDASVR